MNRKLNKDKVLAAIFLLLGILYLIVSLKLPETNLAKDPGPKIFPIIGAVLVIGSSLAILLKRYEELPKAAFTKQQWKKVGVMFAVFVAYAILLWIVGYIPSTILALVITAVMFDRDRKIPFWKKAIFALVVTGLLYFVFSKVLVLLLPQGMLFR